MKSIILKTLVMAMAAMTFAACSSDPTEDGTKDQQETTAPKTDEQTADETVTVPNVQSATTTVSLEDIQKKGLGGIKVQFNMTGITKLELESVDNYQIAGTLGGEKQTIITYNAPDGGTLEAGKEYYIVTFPCDLSGGYRLSIYKGNEVASYFGVHQKVEAGSFITPTDLVESELEFADINAPFVEDERPELDATTKNLLVIYQQNETEENKNALLAQMGIRYDKVVARKKAKLRELEREAKTPDLVAEMQAIVDEMVENRDIRLEQQFWRLVDPRVDDNANDEWLVLRGSDGKNAYIGYAPVRNSEYAAFENSHTYTEGQDNYPAVSVSYTQAVAYCEWLSSTDAKHTYRLPTEVEWILAAGHMPKDVTMNSDHVEKGITAVDAYAQTTGACGGIDFWGNCWEWTSTLNASNQYIVKGGSWDSGRDACRSEYSDDARDGSKGYANVGFRVVREDR